MNQSYHFLVALMILAPLVGSGLWFWVGRKFGEKAVTIGAVSAMAISFIATSSLFFQISEATRVTFFEWIKISPTSTVSFSFLLDSLSLALGMVVTGVGSLIHLYASGYMHGDKSFGRFFTYLNLFVFAMLMLVFSDSLLGIFLGWEGVGLCSYLLISFWFSEETNASAGKKAFIVNRVGDLGFLVAMFALFKAFGTISIPELLAAVQSGALNADQLFWSEVACWGLILGAAGKSAQIPLYVWLPDAMAGPTPVSALIHAATMVTAGVYLACRLQPLFLLHAQMLEVLAFVGGFTAFFAATIAVFQNDIKKVLAYSTISQLGYMFLAVGLAAPVAAYFHLITHAFFKALLFLGAGSVIHGMHHEQDMRKMGGLRSQMPITFWAMTIGVLAIAGVPPLSGFVSKDEILHVVAGSGRWWAQGFAFVTAFLTAFYMGRLWVMTFFGKFRGHHAAHESPWPMTSVLVVLAVASAIAGALNWPHLWGGAEALNAYLTSVVSQAPHAQGAEAFASSVKLAVISALMGLSGLALAFWKYRQFDGKDFKSPIFNLPKEKYYIDELYDFVVVRSLKRLGQFMWKNVDGLIIDGALNGAAELSQQTGRRLRSLQTGLTQQYVFWIWVGLVLLILGAYSLR
jgi:NADH-quinone oxidoreductase subunit L